MWTTKNRPRVISPPLLCQRSCRPDSRIPLIGLFRFAQPPFWPNDIFMFDTDDEANVFRYHPGLLFQTES